MVVSEFYDFNSEQGDVHGVILHIHCNKVETSKAANDH